MCSLSVLHLYYLFISVLFFCLFTVVDRRAWGLGHLAEFLPLKRLAFGQR